jgi:hypothetical protein
MLAFIIFIVLLIKLLLCTNLIFPFNLLCLPSDEINIIAEFLDSTLGLLDPTIILAVLIVLHDFCLLLEIFLYLVLDLLNIILHLILDLVY